MSLTYFNTDRKEYEVMLPKNGSLNIRSEGAKRLSNGLVVTSERHYVSGFIVDALAKYENTGLAPHEIAELEMVTLKNLKSANEMLCKERDKYYKANQNLLDENRKLRSLLRGYLNSEV